MFKVPSLIKINKYKRFEYRPRYYNEIKEQQNDNKLTKEVLEDRWNYNRKTIDIDTKKSTIRLISIIGILVILTYFILKANMTLIDSFLK